MIKRTQALMIIGGGNAVGELLPLIKECTSVDGYKYEVVGILNDDHELKNKEIAGVPVVGTLSDAKTKRGCNLLFAIGSHKTRAIRKDLARSLEVDLRRFETVIHPDARIYSTATIGQGSIIYPGVTVCHGVTLEEFCVITFDAIIAPNVHVGKFSMLTSKSLVLTGANLGQSTFIGANSVIGENVTIGDRTVVAMGSVVFQNVPEDSLVCGNPAKKVANLKALSK